MCYSSNFSILNLLVTITVVARLKIWYIGGLFMKKFSKALLLLGIPVTLLSSTIYASPVEQVMPYSASQQLLNEDALKEKIKNEVASPNTSSSAATQKQIDVAYQNMMDEETYIVELINSLGNKTSLSNWQYNLEFLQNNYDMINMLDNVNMSHVNSYIEGYTYTLKSTQQPSEKINSGQTPYSSYTSRDAVDYALDYIQDYNSSYPDWTSEGGDCANFVSQCLYAGGKSMKGTPGTQSAADNWSNWFSTGSSLNTKNVSSTWRGAAAFRDYWQTNSTGYKKFTSMSSSAYDYGYSGDAISLLNSNGRAYHTLIIVGYGSGGDFKIAAHTDGFVQNGEPYLLSERNLSNGFIIYNID